MKKIFVPLPTWAYSYIFSVLILILTLVVTGRGGASTINSALSLAPYLVLVGMGQMLVITSGPGNIDLSVASVFSLAGYVSIVVYQSTSSVPLSLAAAALVGVVTAIFSVIMINVLKIPPIIATLASGLIITSFTLTLANGFSGSSAPAIKQFVHVKAPLGIPVFAIAVLIISIALAFVLNRSVWGRRLSASGQAFDAASFAGLRPARAIAVTYILSGLLAGLSGALLTAYIAPSPDLGSSYLLDSIAVVIIGGTLMTGGRASVLGVWGGSLFFILLNGLLNLIGWSTAGQNTLKGLLVLAVLFLAGDGVLAKMKNKKRPKKSVVGVENVKSEANA